METTTIQQNEQNTIYTTFNSVDQLAGSEGYFKQMFKGTTKYEYDTRIDDYNWFLLFAVQLIFYFALQALVRKYAPPPGDIKTFKEKKKMNDYHFYYFQYTTFVHAMAGVIFDPIILYYGGYRYDQPNHLYHMILMVHAFAYFVYDSIIEVYYGTDDLLTNAHHVVVLAATYFHIMNKFGGYEYILLHLLAEVSNPFLIFRTVLKIVGMKDSTIYAVNDIIFASVFILVRMFLTPLVLIYMYEGTKVLFAAKIGISFVLYIQLFWCYRILYLLLEKMKSSYKDPAEMPMWVDVSYNLFKDLSFKKQTKLIVSLVNFMWIFVLPVYYYWDTLLSNY